MTILTISSRKGGCGKSTLATALAAALAADEIDVALLDADPNSASYRWATSTYTGPRISAYAEADDEKLAEMLPLLADKHSVLIVDTAGFGNLAATVASASADIVLVPVTPGEGDLTEAERTTLYIGSLGRSIRRQIPLAIIANRIRRGTTLSRHVLAEIDALKLPRLQSVMSEAVAFGELGFSGAIPRNTAAFDEITALVAEMRERGWLPYSRQVVNADIRKAVKA